MDAVFLDDESGEAVSLLTIAENTLISRRVRDGEVWATHVKRCSPFMCFRRMCGVPMHVLKRMKIARARWVF